MVTLSICDNTSATATATPYFQNAPCLVLNYLFGYTSQIMLWSNNKSYDCTTGSHAVKKCRSTWLMFICAVLGYKQSFDADSLWAFLDAIQKAKKCLPT